MKRIVCLMMLVCLVAGCDMLGLKYSLDDISVVYTDNVQSYDEHSAFLIGYVQGDADHSGVSTGFILGKEKDLRDGKEQVGTLDEDNWLIMKVSGLDEATVYYARMFVKYDDKDPDTEDYKYGALISFKTLTFKSAEAVDMGLPSGTEWSSVNVGAENPEDYGGCYSWAETEPKSIAIPTTYKWSKNGQLTKYCNDSSKGYNQLSDGKTEMDPEDDAAQRWMGGNWRVPTAKQMEELMSSSNCKWEIKSRNGVQGILITSLANGNTLFFPIMGGLDRPVWYPQGYYTASLNPSAVEIAYGITATTGDGRAAIPCGYDRWNRMLLRPVTQ